MNQTNMKLTTTILAAALLTGCNKCEDTLALAVIDQLDAGMFKPTMGIDGKNPHVVKDGIRLHGLTIADSNHIYSFSGECGRQVFARTRAILESERIKIAATARTDFSKALGVDQ